MEKLPIDFYRRENVVVIARELLGKLLVTNFNGVHTSGRIVETEAYAGVTDRASHAWGGRRTARTEPMYSQGAISYVYLCYGLHQMFNVVTNSPGVPHAILVRAIEPISGIDHMLGRTGKLHLDNTLTRGPGNVAKALGIVKAHTGVDLTGEELYIASDGYEPDEEEIGTSTRIGVAYAGADALRPYRFYIRGNKFVSGKPNR